MKIVLSSVNGHVVKPVTFDELVKAIKESGQAYDDVTETHAHIVTFLDQPDTLMIVLLKSGDSYTITIGE